MYNAILLGAVPKSWARAAYPSLKPLGSWVEDLLLRIEAYNRWLTQGLPLSFWPSGYFFPQGFFTSVLQTFARAYRIPIDTLQFETTVLAFKGEEALAHAMSSGGGGKDAFGPNSDVRKGVLLRGLFLQGARWSQEHVAEGTNEPRKFWLEYA